MDSGYYMKNFNNWFMNEEYKSINSIQNQIKEIAGKISHVPANDIIKELKSISLHLANDKAKRVWEDTVRGLRENWADADEYIKQLMNQAQDIHRNVAAAPKETGKKGIVQAVDPYEYLKTISGKPAKEVLPSSSLATKLPADLSSKLDKNTFVNYKQSDEEPKSPDDASIVSSFLNYKKAKEEQSKKEPVSADASTVNVVSKSNDELYKKHHKEVLDKLNDMSEKISMTRNPLQNNQEDKAYKAIEMLNGIGLFGTSQNITAKLYHPFSKETISLMPTKDTFLSFSDDPDLVSKVIDLAYQDQNFILILNNKKRNFRLGDLDSLETASNGIDMTSLPNKWASKELFTKRNQKATPISGEKAQTSLNSAYAEIKSKREQEHARLAAQDVKWGKPPRDISSVPWDEFLDIYPHLKTALRKKIKEEEGQIKNTRKKRQK